MEGMECEDKEQGRKLIAYMVRDPVAMKDLTAALELTTLQTGVSSRCCGVRRENYG